VRNLVLLLGLTTFLAEAKDVAGPSQFYIVSSYFSDAGALFYYRLIDVRQEGSDAIIRYSRIAPVSQWCPRVMVQSAEARVANTSPAALVGTKNPCVVKPANLGIALRKYRQKAGVLEAISFGVVAQCGSASIVLRLPIDQAVRMSALKAAHPEIARLWDLPGEITERGFGPKDIFHDRAEEDESALQQAGEKVVPELLAGPFDMGLMEAVQGNVGTGQPPSFRSLLASYQGPVSVAEANRRAVPTLRNTERYRFTEYLAFPYPPLAAQAHIEGQVDLQLAVDQLTGKVLDTVATAGHPLLKEAAVHAAKQWRFDPESMSSGNISLTLDYSLQCR
jgi:Gram-negative bacterial TonB protein C-terminal